MSIFETINDLASKARGSMPGNKRRHQRIAWDCCAALRRNAPHTVGGINQGILRDISEGGMGVRAFRPMSINDEVALDIHCRGLEQPLSATGSVVWAEPANDSGHWELGIQFIKVDDRFRKTIQQRAAAC